MSMRWARASQGNRYVFLRVIQYNTTRIFWGPSSIALAENVLFKHKSPIAQAHGKDNPKPKTLGQRVPSPRVPLWDCRSRASVSSYSYEAENIRLVLHCCTRMPFFFLDDHRAGLLNVTLHFCADFRRRMRLENQFFGTWRRQCMGPEGYT